MPGWRKLQLVEIGRAFGIRVSDLLEMRDAGYGPTIRLAVDDAYLGFVQQFEQLREMTKLVNAPQRDKHAKPQVPVPMYSVDDLKRFLDIPVRGDPPSRLLGLGGPLSRSLDDWANANWDVEP